MVKNEGISESDFEQFTHTLIEQTMVGFVVFGLDGVVQFANPAAEALLVDLTDSLMGFRFQVPEMGKKTAINLPDLNGSRVIEYQSSEITWQGETAYLAVLHDVTQRTRAEEQLRERERLLRETNQMARVGGWEILLAEGKVWWSDVTREIHEVEDDYSPTLLEALDFFPGEAKEELRQAIVRLQEEGASYDMELPFITAKGNPRWVRAMGQAEFDAGVCGRIWGTFQDITQHKEIQQKLSHSEKRYRQLFEFDINGFALSELVTDNAGQPVDFIFREVNQAFEELLGLEREDVLNKSAADFLLNIEKMALWNALIEVVQTRKPQRIQTYSDIYDKHFQIIAFSPEEGLVATIFNDITEQMHAEEQLERSEKQFRTLYETMAQGVVYQNAKGETLSANPAAERILGLSLEQMQASTSMDPGWSSVRMNGKPLPGSEHPSMVALRTGERVEDFVMGINNSKRKEVVWLNVTAIPLYHDGEDLPYEVCTTFLDITDRIRVQRVLEERVKELKCISNISAAIQNNLSIEGICRVTAEELVQAVQFPEIARASVTLAGEVYQQDGFVDLAGNGLQVPIQLNGKTMGSVKICYLQDLTFLIPEEIELLRNAAERLATYFERQETQGQLEASEKRFRTAVMEAPYPIMIHNENGEVLTINDAWAGISGYSREELPTLIDWAEKTFGARSEEIMTLIQENYYAENRLDEQEFSILTKFGERRIWQLTSAPLGKLPDGTQTLITMARDITDQKRYYDRILSLREIDQVISSTLDLDEVLDRITSELSVLIQYDSMSVMLLEDNTLEIIAGRGFEFPEEIIGLTFPNDPDYPNYEVIEKKRPVTSDHVSEDYPNFTQPLNVELSERIKSWLGVPLMSQAGVMGMFAIDRKEAEAFTKDDVQIAMEFGSRAAIAIRNAQLYKRTRQQLEQLGILRKIDAIITSSLALHEALPIILQHIQEGLQIDAAAIFLFEEDSQTLHFREGIGFKSGIDRDVEIRLGQGYTGKIALERKGAFIPQVGYPEDSDYPINFAEEGIISYYGLPLIAKGSLEGVLQIHHRRRLSPGEDWFIFAEALASQTALAIDHISLFNHLEEANQELVKAYDATIEGWARALELRDKETEGHSRSVVDLSVQVAKVFGFSPEDLQHIRRGVFLHDIGKMGIPDEILYKPGPLTDEEWDIMREHPRFAYEMLKDIDYLEPALIIPHYHHERWDGSGYPEGLKGEEIPLEARIFAVVDVWDALNSNRYYRQAWSSEEAITFLRENAGILFDAEVVSVLLKIVQEN